MGDSTTEQWHDFIVKSVPTLIAINNYMAVDMENNIIIQHHAHNTPYMLGDGHIMADMHLLSNAIDDLAGDPHTVLVLNICAHFSSFPRSYYAYRVSLLKRAVAALLRRAPETKVIIKTANTGHREFYRYNWTYMQSDRILREAFYDLGVYILDVWQMTACHYNEADLHPGPVIIKNEVDILLSFICPM
ncbi:NXPE family member 3-like [Sardina pilchardus]|uniref:NXPE family member 3-like n=1 Tax=Sardina pilchardus TaxID=27697 RepID=UPI002E153B8F